MYFGLLITLYIVGLFLASFCGMIPGDTQLIIPYYFRFLMFMVGGMLGLMGIMMLMIRAKKTGAEHLIRPGRPGLINWLYIYADGEMRITPSNRVGEGQLYNPDLDSQIIDAKTYTMGDHRFRIVPEVVGHAVDLDYVYYVNLLHTKYGFENLREARQGRIEHILNKFGVKRTKEFLGTEHTLVGDENESLSEKIKRISATKQQPSTKY